MDKKISRYRDLKFSPDKQFNEWLNKTYTMIIDLEDNGQYLLRIWTDEYGEILHSNAQTSIWCGRFIDISKIKVGECIRLHNPEDGKWYTMGRQVIENFKYNGDL